MGRLQSGWASNNHLPQPGKGHFRGKETPSRSHYHCGNIAAEAGGELSSILASAKSGAPRRDQAKGSDANYLCRLPAFIKQLILLYILLEG